MPRTRGAAKRTIRVASYNVLSSSLSRASAYTKNNAEDLDPSKRLKRVKKHLDKEIAAGAVICLQEVSMVWAGQLHTYFEKKDYKFIETLYGSRFNGYMGVGIAWPANKYSLDSSEITKPAECKDFVKPEEDNDNKEKTKEKDAPATADANDVGFLAGIASFFTSWFSPVAVAKPPLFPRPGRGDFWYDIKRRWNSMIVLKLKCQETDAVFAVGTYHMPCSYTKPKVMAAHAALAGQDFIRAVGDPGMPQFLGGDFNFQPGSTCYTIVTEGSIPRDHEDHPPPAPLEDPWGASLAYPLKSAYAESDIGEPEYTNRSCMMDNDFTGTLDYVFFANATVQEVKDIGSVDALKGAVLPTANEPSDHVLVAASFSV